MDYDNREVEERWCSERRNDVIAYLHQHSLPHGQIGEWPAWHCAPYISIWAIESDANPGWVGWWVIAGDLPVDHVSASTIRHPRDAMTAFAARWRMAAGHMAHGDASPDVSIGIPANRRSLASLLASRAEVLQSWATGSALWDNL
jgi:hypothetical protein